ncbi:MAG: KH domain-containing protein [Coriobacteriaceae bacterium]|nr:KH domain-containing protein [Coriobacteriaceae bacterium]
MTRTSDTGSLVRYLVTSLVEFPDDVVIEHEDTPDGAVYRVTVNPEDTGKIIGRQGRIIKSIRTLVRAAGSVDGTSVEVEVVG